MLNSAIKRDAFIPYKKSCFYNMKSLKNAKVFYFYLQSLTRNVPDNISIRSISEIGKDHVKFYPLSFHLKFYHKNQAHGSYHFRLVVDSSLFSAIVWKTMQFGRNIY